MICDFRNIKIIDIYNSFTKNFQNTQKYHLYKNVFWRLMKLGKYISLPAILIIFLLIRNKYNNPNYNYNRNHNNNDNDIDNDLYLRPHKIYE